MPNFVENVPCRDLGQIWWNKSFGVCGSEVVLTLYSGEKKKQYAKIESSITLRRYSDLVIILQRSHWHWQQSALWFLYMLF